MESNFKKIVLSFMLLIVALCSAQENVAEHYKTGNFDVAIFPASYEDFMISANRFTPTKDEVNKAEKALKEKLNADNPGKIKLNKYRRQYFGHIDQNGNRILYINAFYYKKNEYSYWLSSIVTVFDGGCNYWNTEYVIETGKVSDITCNGEA